MLLARERLSICVVCLQLCDSQADDTATARQLSKQWFVELLLASDQYLSTVILNERPDSGKCML